MIKPNAFDVTVKAAGVDIHRQVDENTGSRIVSIILACDESGKDEDLDPPSNGSIRDKSEQSPAPRSREAFFAQLKNSKPSDSALAIAAYHYSQYGCLEFSVDEMRDLADDVGFTVPERLDMTFLQAKRKGNRLFRRGGRGSFRPTVHGETFFKLLYKVAKGTNQKPTRAGK